MDEKEDILKKGQKLLFIFFLFLLLFNWPVLSVFNIGSFFFGLPELYVYFFVTWALLILLLYFAVQNSTKNKSTDE